MRCKIALNAACSHPFVPQSGCCGGGTSRARFANQPRDEALPTVEELRALEADIVAELDTLKNDDVETGARRNP
jgi:hypothetical protein